MAENKMNVYQRLAEVRKSVEYLQKDSKSAQFAYVSSAAVLGSLREAIDKNGLILVPEVLESKLNTYERENAKGKPMNEYLTEISMVFKWVNIDNPEDVVCCRWYSQGVDLAGEKGVGKALTYGEKYFLLKFFNIPTDNDDPDNFQGKNEARKATARASEEQKEEIKIQAAAYSKARGMDSEEAELQMIDWALKQVKAKGFDNLESGQADNAITLLKTMILKQKKEIESTDDPEAVKKKK